MPVASWVALRLHLSSIRSQLLLWKEMMVKPSPWDCDELQWISLGQGQAGRWCPVKPAAFSLPWHNFRAKLAFLLLSPLCHAACWACSLLSCLSPWQSSPWTFRMGTPFVRGLRLNQGNGCREVNSWHLAAQYLTLDSEQRNVCLCFHDQERTAG